MIKFILRLTSLVLILFVTNLVVASDFKLTDINGKSHNLSDYKGKWVIVNYWVDELPELVDFYEEHKNKDAVVLGINYEDVDQKYLKEFVDEYFISYPILPADPGKGKADFWGPITGLPTTVIISPTGEMVSRRVGRINGQFLENVINSKSKDVSYK